ncbi:TPA: hypothetical protein R8I27_001664 [Campylobacter jejuni]|uniref:hypothetical protein n=1 Tax=Campylobacter jejuni TaxID=197 RepID=UPI000F809452|nr:hypothetical protein [Campylobacter jejuni]EAK0091962.1 hypothetical protein [Campylobacter jejuni]EAK2833550.1 hypothetical protein [Campylobacter jejuni]EAK4775910.1 hypothetical protein [Campylobacter jejuni]EAL0098193.1 hypothetical protein [Campylobacter jejuni]ECL0298831.1 hypothetical protein [Campylobacter jejuni]
MIVTIQKYLADNIKEFRGNNGNGRLSNREALAELLGVNISMISIYSKSNVTPSLKVAINLYKNTGVVLHPFSEESLKYEINKGIKNEQ